MKGLLKRIGYVLASLGSLMVIVSATPVVEWWAKGLAGPLDEPKGDTLIVLGGNVLDQGTIGISSYWRSVYAVRAYRQGGFHQVLISGGRDTLGNVIARPMADFLICQGVPRENIWIEDRSTSTRENALFSRDVLKQVPGRMVLLTSDYHMYRAARAFRKAGLDIIPRPCPDAIKRGTTWRGRWPAFVELVAETGKIAYYKARGWI